VKRSLFSFLCLSLILLASCQFRQQDCSSPDVFCAGLVSEIGPMDDGGLNQATWEQLQNAYEAGFVDEINYIETIDNRDYRANIEAFIEAGYDLVVTIGYNAEEDTDYEAKHAPEVMFVGVDQYTPTKFINLTRITFPEDQAGFLAGALAAYMTQTGEVGAVCESEGIEDVYLYCEGFYYGAAYANPDVDTWVMYRPGGSREEFFNDPEWGQAAALKLIEDDADVIFAYGGQTAEAALEAAAQSDIYVIGAERDLYLSLPEVGSRVLSSVVKSPDPVLYQLLEVAAAGNFPGGQYPGNVALTSFHDLDSQIPESVRVQLAEIRHDLQIGALETGVKPKPKSPEQDDESN
jgi:basic membrane protein A